MSTAEQLTLADYVQEMESERAQTRAKDRRRKRAWIVFATHPDRVEQEDYKLVFTCDASTQAEAEAKVRDIVESERRVVAYLASGKYASLLAEARPLT